MAFGKKDGDRVAWLSQVAFFEGFTDEELQRVVALGSEVEAEPGALLMDQGDAGVDCYVIVEGTATVYVAGDAIAGLAPGTMVGEMALVDHRPRTASVVADTHMRMLRFDAKHFRRLLDEMPKASERVMTLLRERLER
jgi:CRP-like cAMP-binding protein